MGAGASVNRSKHNDLSNKNNVSKIFKKLPIRSRPAIALSSESFSTIASMPHALSGIDDFGFKERKELLAEEDNVQSNTTEDTRKITGRQNSELHPLGNSAILSSTSNSFCSVISQASEQLRLRQREGKAALTRIEMEDIVMLSRELENIRKMMKEIQLSVEGTWNILEKEGTMERFGQQLYDVLFDNNPNLRCFFKNVDYVEQSKVLLRMLGTAVHFYNNPQYTTHLLIRAGARHRLYGISAGILCEMKKAFFQVFPKFIGEEVFEAVAEEWEAFWKLILDLMEQGYHSEEGERLGKLYEAKLFKEIQKNFELLTERQSKCDVRHQFVGIMYSKVIEMNGDFSKLEELKDVHLSNRVFGTYVNIVKHLNDKEKVQEYLLELGTSPSPYNIDTAKLNSYMEPFLFACRYFLQDEWNTSMEQSFRQLFLYISDGIFARLTSGMNSFENKRAPTQIPTFCLIFTDIESSTDLWQRDSLMMGDVVRHHHRLIRSLIAEYCAYEVKTVGDSFMIAAQDVFVGIKIAFSIQLELMRMAPIVPNFKMIEKTEGYGDPSAWNNTTLHVRIGIEHCTEATAVYDSVHQRYDYYGPSVNRCSRIMAVTCGGQIAMSRQTFEYLETIPAFREEPCPGNLRELAILPKEDLDDRGLSSFLVVCNMGSISLKGFREPIDLVSVLPKCLSGRKFINKLNLTTEDT